MNISFSTAASIVFVLLLIEGFFSGSEIAILSVDRIFLKSKANQGNRGAKLALFFANNPEKLLAVTLLITSLCIVTISTLTLLYFASLNISHAELWATLVSSPLVVFFGELLPKTFYQRFSKRLSTSVSYLIFATFYIFYPITLLISLYTTRLARIAGPIEELFTGKKKTIRDELRTLLTAGAGTKDSEINTTEKKMIHRILNFKDSETQNALIPLVQTEAIEEGESALEALKKFTINRFSRMPIYSDRIDNITGIVKASDLLSATNLEHPVKNYASPAHFVPETQSLENLLLDMRREGYEMAIVVDEYGGSVGVLTIEDVIEEIVGEIHDEFDTDTSPLKEISKNHWMIQSRSEIKNINEQLKLSIPEGPYETIGGFLLQQFGRIPKAGDELYFESPAGTLKFSVRKANSRQIETVAIFLSPRSQYE